MILATGARLRTLGVEGEERLRGRGVSHCASCDAPLMRDRTVGVVGGGDSALQEALTLAEAVGEVIVLHRGDALSAQAAYREPALAHPKIDVRYGTVVEEILGEDAVSGVRVRDARRATRRSSSSAGVFVYVGLAPNSEYLRDRSTSTTTGGCRPTPRCRPSSRACSRPGSCAAARSGRQPSRPARARRRPRRLIATSEESGGQQQSTPAPAAARGNGGSHV